MGRGKRSTSEDTVIDHLIDIGEYGCALKASDNVIERAQIILKELMEKNGCLRKKNLSAIYAACLYVAGRQHDEMKTMEEVAEKTSVQKKDIFKALQFIKDIIPAAASPTLFLTGAQSQRQQKPGDLNENDQNDKCIKSRDNGEVSTELLMAAQRIRAHTLRLCDVLKFDSEQAKYAEDMAMTVSDCNIRLCSLPATQAGAIVWICSLFTGSKEVDIKVIVKHSTGRISIRKTYKLLVPHLPMLLPKHILGDSENWKKKLRLP